MIYYVFTELYGKANTTIAPEITRYICDIYARSVDATDLLQIQLPWQMKAKAKVSEMRRLWTPPPPIDEVLYCVLSHSLSSVYCYYY